MADAAPPTPKDAFFAATYEVAKGAVTRSREGAQFVEKAAAGIATVYAAVLAVVFSVAENPMPMRGIIPATFLGLALALAAFALAFPVSATTMDAPKARGTALEWFNSFATWISELSLRRSKLMRASLLSLMFGVFFLPAPFIHVKADTPSNAATEAKQGWPTAPATHIELQKILYQAQVAEVAKLREEASPPPSGQFAVREWWIWLAAAVGLLVVAGSAVIGAPKVPDLGSGRLVGIIIPTYIEPPNPLD